MPETFPRPGEDRVPPFSTPAAALNGIRRVPPPVNEPVRAYAPGSPEKNSRLIPKFFGSTPSFSATSAR